MYNFASGPAMIPMEVLLQAQSEILNWLSAIENTPKKIFLIHGELTSIDSLRLKITDEMGWNTHIPSLYESLEIDL